MGVSGWLRLVARDSSWCFGMSRGTLIITRGSIEMSGVNRLLARRRFTDYSTEASLTPRFSFSSII